VEETGVLREFNLIHFNVYINFKQILTSDDFFLNNNSVKLAKEKVCVDLLRLYHAVSSVDIFF
jgi:hypothetical protein